MSTLALADGSSSSCLGVGSTLDFFMTDTEVSLDTTRLSYCLMSSWLCPLIDSSSASASSYIFNFFTRRLSVDICPRPLDAPSSVSCLVSWASTCATLLLRFTGFIIVRGSRMSLHIFSLDVRVLALSYNTRYNLRLTVAFSTGKLSSSCSSFSLSSC